jgi:hypothetical protein
MPREAWEAGPGWWDARRAGWLRTVSWRRPAPWDALQEAPWRAVHPRELAAGPPWDGEPGPAALQEQRCVVRPHPDLAEHRAPAAREAGRGAQACPLRGSAARRGRLHRASGPPRVRRGRRPRTRCVAEHRRARQVWGPGAHPEPLGARARRREVGREACRSGQGVGTSAVPASPLRPRRGGRRCGPRAESGGWIPWSAGCLPRTCPRTASAWWSSSGPSPCHTRTR